MKVFHDFNPLSPFPFQETLQIVNREVHLAHIPLKDSVQIRGFIQVDIPADVVSNTFWVDYRAEDGYRSANGKIIFDSSRDGEFIDVSYYGVGTVLRATDMNDVADSLDHLDSVATELAILQGDFGIRLNSAKQDFADDLIAHNSSFSSHSDIRDSILANKDEFTYQIDAIKAISNGINTRLDTVTNNLQREIELAAQGNSSIVSAANAYTDSIIAGISSRLSDVSNEILGLYSQIDEGDQSVAFHLDSLAAKIDNDIAVERLSAITANNNLRTELISRIHSEVDSLFADNSDSIKAELTNLIAANGSEIQSINDRVNSTADFADANYSSILALQVLLDVERDNRLADGSSLASSIYSLSTDFDDSVGSLFDSFASLSNTVYQARQAVNNQLESMRADVSIANDNLTFSRQLFDNKISYIESLGSSIDDTFDSVLSVYEGELDSLQSSINTAFDNLIDSFGSTADSITTSFSDQYSLMMDNFDSRFNSMVADAENAQSLFSTAYQSLSSALDNLASMDNVIGSSIQSAIDAIPSVDFSSVEASIQRAYDYVLVATSPIETSVSDILDSLDNFDVDLSPVEQSINAVIDSLSNMDVDFSPVESSLAAIGSSVRAAGSNITRINTTLTAYGSRLSALENNSSALVLTSVSSNRNGAMWYVP